MTVRDYYTSGIFQRRIYFQLLRANNSPCARKQLYNKLVRTNNSPRKMPCILSVEVVCSEKAIIVSEK